VFNHSSSLKRQVLYHLRQLHKFQARRMKMITVTHIEVKVALYFFTPAIKRRLVK
jgi:hypothetical protein